MHRGFNNGRPTMEDTGQFNVDCAVLLTDVIASVTGASTVYEWVECSLHALEFISNNSKRRD